MKHEFNEDTAPSILTLRIQHSAAGASQLVDRIKGHDIDWLGEQIDGNTGSTIPGTAVLKIHDQNIGPSFFDGLTLCRVDTSIANRGRKTQPVTANGKLITSETVIPDDFRPGGTD